jgi:hypothetical protein
MRCTTTTTWLENRSTIVRLSAREDLAASEKDCEEISTEAAEGGEEGGEEGAEA